MTFEEAFREMAKKYFSGVQPDKMKETTGKKLKYTKKYFDKQAKKKNIDQSELDGFNTDDTE